MSSSAPPEVKAAAGELFQTFADQVAKREEIRTQALAEAWELPAPTIQRNTTTHNHFPIAGTPGPTAQPIAQPPATTPQAIASGLSGLVKTAIAAAAILGTGGIGAGVWALLSQAAPAVVPAIAPAIPNGQVTIGINADGTLYDPSKPGGQP